MHELAHGAALGFVTTRLDTQRAVKIARHRAGVVLQKLDELDTIKAHRRRHRCRKKRHHHAHAQIHPPQHHHNQYHRHDARNHQLRVAGLHLLQAFAGLKAREEIQPHRNRDQRDQHRCRNRQISHRLAREHNCHHATQHQRQGEFVVRGKHQRRKHANQKPAQSTADRDHQIEAGEITRRRLQGRQLAVAKHAHHKKADAVDRHRFFDRPNAALEGEAPRHDRQDHEEWPQEEFALVPLAVKT